MIRLEFKDSVLYEKTPQTLLRLLDTNNYCGMIIEL